MWEIIKHSLGLCGEGHLNIWHILGGLGTTFAIFFQYVRLFFFNFISLFKKSKKTE